VNEPGEWLQMEDGREFTPDVTWREEDGTECARWFVRGGRTLERRHYPDHRIEWWRTEGGLDDPPRLITIAPPGGVLPDDLPEVS
jgi:hypothetical protein